MEILIYLDILMLSGNIRVCGSILVLRSRSKCNYAVLLQSSAILRLRREKLGKFEKLKPKDVFLWHLDIHNCNQLPVCWSTDRYIKCRSKRGRVRARLHFTVIKLHLQLWRYTLNMEGSVCAVLVGVYMCVWRRRKGGGVIIYLCFETKSGSLEPRCRPPPPPLDPSVPCEGGRCC